MDKTKEITNLIERLDVFEDRLSVKITAISAWIETDYHRPYVVKVNGELHSQNGTTLKQPTWVVVDVYDTSGRILGTNNQGTSFLEFIEPESFFGFHTFSIDAQIPIAAVGKVRVYPKRYKD